MNDQTTNIEPTREERIGLLAYEIWQREGCPDGKHEDHWHLACDIIDAEDQGTAPTAMPAWLSRSEEQAPIRTSKRHEKVVNHPSHRSAA